MTHRRSLVPVLIALVLLLAVGCGGEKKVGSAALLKGADGKGGLRLGETTTTRAPRPGSGTRSQASGAKAGIGATTTTTQAPQTQETTTTTRQATTTTTQRQAAVFQISIKGDTGGSAFDPSVARVFEGTTVRFVNRDTKARSIVADNSAFDSGSIPPGDSWEWTAVPGQYNYHDGTRPYAVGSLEVVAT
jgi:plastocyanin